MGPPKLSMPTVNKELIQLYDDFAEFNDHCSFLCDVIPLLLNDQCDTDIHTLKGVSRHCGWLKLRAEELKLDLSDVLEKIYSEEQAVNVLETLE